MRRSFVLFGRANAEGRSDPPAAYSVEIEAEIITDVAFSSDPEGALPFPGAPARVRALVLAASGRVYGIATPGRYTVAVPLPERAVDISAGSAHFACVSDTGMAYLWGRNGSGQCGGGAGAGWAGLAAAADDDAVDADDVEPGVMPGASDGASRDSGDHSGPDRGEAMVASDNVTDTVPANPDTAAKVVIPRSSIAAFPREYRGMTPLFVKSRTGSARAGTQGYDRLAFADAESLARARNGIRGTNAKDAPPLPGTVTRFARIAAGPAHTLLLAGSGAVYAVGGAGGSALHEVLATKGLPIVSIGTNEEHCVCLSALGDIFAFRVGNAGSVSQGTASSDGRGPWLPESARGPPLVIRADDAMSLFTAPALSNGRVWSVGVDGRLHVWGRGETHVFDGFRPGIEASEEAGAAGAAGGVTAVPIAVGPATDPLPRRQSLSFLKDEDQVLRLRGGPTWSAVFFASPLFVAGEDLDNVCDDDRAGGTGRLPRSSKGPPRPCHAPGCTFACISGGCGMHGTGPMSGPCPDHADGPCVCATALGPRFIPLDAMVELVAAVASSEAVRVEDVVDAVAHTWSTPNALCGSLLPTAFGSLGERLCGDGEGGGDGRGGRGGRPRKVGVKHHFHGLLPAVLEKLHVMLLAASPVVTRAMCSAIGSCAGRLMTGLVAKDATVAPRTVIDDTAVRSIALLLLNPLVSHRGDAHSYGLPAQYLDLLHTIHRGLGPRQRGVLARTLSATWTAGEPGAPRLVPGDASSMMMAAQMSISAATPGSSLHAAASSSADQSCWFVVPPHVFKARVLAPYLAHVARLVAAEPPPYVLGHGIFVAASGLGAVIAHAAWRSSENARPLFTDPITGIAGSRIADEADLVSKELSAAMVVAPNSFLCELAAADFGSAAQISRETAKHPLGKGYYGSLLRLAPHLLSPALKHQLLMAEAGLSRVQPMITPTGAYVAADPHPPMRIAVRRGNLVSDAMSSVVAHYGGVGLRIDHDGSSQTIRITDFPKPPLPHPWLRLDVRFVDEDGQDEGGLRRELFSLLVDHLMDDGYGMFSYDPETRLRWFAPPLIDNDPEMLRNFRLIGRVLALSIHTDALVDLRLPPVAFKLLLKLRPFVTPGLGGGVVDGQTFMGDFLPADVQGVSPSVRRTLRMIAACESEDEIEAMALSFPDPLDAREVTLATRDDLVDAVARWTCFGSVAGPIVEFAAGFWELVGRFSLASVLTARELETVTIGVRHLDMRALRDAAVNESPAAKWLWEIVVDEYDVDAQRRFLRFATGSDRAPPGGLGALKVTVQRTAEPADRLPTAHTCFNYIVLPDYKSKDQLRSKLAKAIELGGEGFGLV